MGYQSVGIWYENLYKFLQPDSPQLPLDVQRHECEHMGCAVNGLWDVSYWNHHGVPVCLGTFDTWAEAMTFADKLAHQKPVW